MTPVDVAELLERYAVRVIELPGVSRTRPHAFAEAKSELAGAMRAEAKRLRLGEAEQHSVATVPIGPRRLPGRVILVERRNQRP